MSEETNQDETAQFTATSSDLPEVKTETVEEPAKEAEPEQDEAETESEEQNTTVSDTTAEDSTAKKPKGVQKRIDKLVREREAEKREKEALQAKIDALENKEDKEPVESDFEDYDQYLDALDAHKSKDTETNQPESKPVESDKAIKLTDSQKTAVAIFNEKVKAASKPDDFEAVAFDESVPVTGDMLEALAECDDPAKVLYHLGKNKEVAAAIAEGSPAQQMREIAKLDLTVKVKPAKPVNLTNAPDPITPVGKSGAKEKPVSEMSFSEYEAHQNKIEQARKSTW